jgi:hypothetical protein
MARGPQTDLANASAVETPPEAPDAALMARVLAKLEDLEQQNAVLREEVRQARTTPNQFKPMEPPAGAKQRRGVWSSINEALQSMPNGWTETPVATGVSNLTLIDVHGEKIPDRMLAQIGPRFGEGDAVRINPEAKRSEDGDTWGNILARQAANARKGQVANPLGVGTVVKILWLTDDEGWKYKGRVPGITGQRTDGFHDRELLPA